MFSLCNFVISSALGIFALIPVLGAIFRIVISVFNLVVFIPGITVGVRRLHDTDRAGSKYLLTLTTLLFIPIIVIFFMTFSGVVLLFMLVPMIGPIILLVYFVQEGTSGENKYGPDPKGKDSERRQIKKKQSGDSDSGSKAKSGAAICKNCGEENDKDAKFCKSCGGALKGK